MASISPDIDAARSKVSEASTKAQAALADAMNKLAEASQQVQERDRLKVPNEMRGTILLYEYGPSKVPHPSSTAMPTHRLTVDCGQQVMLALVIGSDRWDKFVADNNIEMDAVLEGKRITIKRDTSYGRFVPIKILEGEALGNGSDGETLFPGDRVRCVDGIEATVEGWVNQYSGTYIELRRDDGEGANQLTDYATYDEDYGGYLYVCQPAEVTLA